MSYLQQIKSTSKHIFQTEFFTIFSIIVYLRLAYSYYFIEIRAIQIQTSINTIFNRTHIS